MNKSLVIAILALVIGAGTIGLGLYVLATTPAPTTKSVAVAPEQNRLVVLPPAPESTGTDIPSAPVERGSEPWCEQLMVTPDSDWSDADARLFATQCIYE